MKKLLPNLGALPLQGLGNRPLATIAATFDDLSADELGVVLMQTIRGVPVPANMTPMTPATIQFFAMMCDALRTMRVTVPAIGRGLYGGAAVPALKEMADLMQVDLLESERRGGTGIGGPNEDIRAYEQRLNYLLNQRCAFMDRVGALMYNNANLTPYDLQEIANAAVVALTANEPTLNAGWSTRAARAVWLCKNGSPNTTYTALHYLIANQLDRMLTTISVHPPNQNFTVNDTLCGQLLSANLARPAALRMADADVSRLLVLCAQHSRDAAFSDLTAAYQGVLEPTNDLPQVLMHAMLHNDILTMIAVNRPGVISDVQWGTQPLGAQHMQLALNRATTVAHVRILYSPFPAGGFASQQRGILNQMRTALARHMIDRDLHGGPPVTEAEIRHYVVLPGVSIGSENALLLIRAILTLRASTGLPHPHRAQLAPLALSLVQQVSSPSVRLQLEQNGREMNSPMHMPEFATYHADSNSFY